MEKKYPEPVYVKHDVPNNHLLYFFQCHSEIITNKSLVFLFMKTQAHSNFTYILNKIKMMHLVTQ